MIASKALLIAAVSLITLREANTFLAPLPLSRRPVARWMCSASGTPKVALTRELGKNDKLAKLLHEKGYETCEVPCIAFEEGTDAKSLPEALRQPWEWVIVTSPEAADVFLTGWQAAGDPCSSWPTIPERREGAGQAMMTRLCVRRRKPKIGRGVRGGCHC